MWSTRAARIKHLARLSTFLVAMSVVWMAGPVALAQTPSPKTSGGEAPVDAGPKAAQPIPLEDVPDRAEATRTALDTIVPKDAPTQMLERIGEEVV